MVTNVLADISQCTIMIKFFLFQHYDLQETHKPTEDQFANEASKSEIYRTKEYERKMIGIPILRQ